MGRPQLAPGRCGPADVPGKRLLIYYVWILFTEFVFLKRGVSWSEVFMIAPWPLLLGIEGGMNSSPLGAAGALGAGLFLLGSWMNSYAEYTRHVWKQRPENCGRLYTEGLFRYSRHAPPNASRITQ